MDISLTNEEHKRCVATRKVVLQRKRKWQLGRFMEEQLRKVALERKRARQLVSLTEEQLDVIAENCKHGLLQKSALQVLLFPAPPDGWVRGKCPKEPADFEDSFVLPGHSIKLLQLCHPHARDCRLQFFPADHRYEIDGEVTLGSVTSLVHEFSEKFDPDSVIEKMRSGPRWPRPGYTHADGSPMSPQEIKQMWQANATVSGNQGTWAHYMCECFLNKEPMGSGSFRKEVELFLKFLGTLQNHMPYRTEWEIFAEDIKLAGSIDFVAKAPDGTFVIVDWKRTKEMHTKFHNLFRTLKDPLNHLEDCAGLLYRIQVNVYRLILEKYYGLPVSRMFLVGIHPDCGDSPFVDIVPRMDLEAEVVFERQRCKANGML